MIQLDDMIHNPYRLYRYPKDSKDIGSWREFYTIYLPEYLLIGQVFIFNFVIAYSAGRDCDGSRTHVQLVAVAQ